MSQRPSPQLHESIAKTLALSAASVRAVLALQEQGATVPFIARYRKEATGGLDETQIRATLEHAAALQALSKRRAAILSSLSERQLLTAELKRQLELADSLQGLEDLYLPFKPKRQTRADRAREQGLAGLADAMWEQGQHGARELARAYVDAAKNVSDIDAALAGARDICAERLAADVELRQRTRELYWKHCRVIVKKTSKFAAAVTKFDSQLGELRRLDAVASHRWLACKRGEDEGVLRLNFEFDAEGLQRSAERALRRPAHGSWREQSSIWVKDAFQRLLIPAAKADARRRLDELAEREAIDIFARNLRELLLAAPLGAKAVLGIDPGQRTGCKCTLVDASGKLVATDTIFLVQGDAQKARAADQLRRLVEQAPTPVIAIGNGTHGRETQQFVKQVFEDHKPAPPLCVSVNEAGASVYSASDVARREFPELDVSYRGAVSIARRLQDPLAELVKIDPQSIGVGQYQHDIDASKLQKRLNEVVESCVNSVGVDLNTASPELLAHVAGLGPTLASRIVSYRHEHGTISERRRLLEVKGLGAKAYEQCAGFLRIRAGKNPLDATAVHPERYVLVETMARTQGVSVAELLGNAVLVSKLKLEDFRDGELGEFTLSDIVSELARPGRDPRAAFEAPAFAEGVNSIEDVKPGMKLAGVVTNVAAFGAFVDIGVHQDGLIHISKLAKHFIKDPNEVVRVGQTLEVEVLDVDLQRKRISLARRF